MEIFLIKSRQLPRGYDHNVIISEYLNCGVQVKFESKN